MRLLALTSRFVFLFSAAFFMTPEAFGIYGLIAASSHVFLQIAGVEAYAVVMRRVATTEAGAASDDRPFYGRFVGLSSSLAFGMGAGLGLAFGWPVEIVLLAGGVAAVEYAGVEVMRILVAEGRAGLSLIAAAIRHVPWAFGLPLLGLLDILPGPWAPELVLAAWVVSGLASLGLIAPVWRRYAAAPYGAFGRWYGAVLRGAPKWILIALAPRFLESGVRVIPGAVIDEAAAGRFVFLATLAGIGAIGVRSVIEPFFFTAMLEPRTGAAARRRFAKATVAMLGLGAVASGLGWWMVTGPGGKDLGPDSGPTLALLMVAAAAASLAQVAHYQLYAAHRDGAIFRASVTTLVIGVPLVLALTLGAGPLGTAFGAALTATLLLVLKAWLAGRCTPAHAGLPAS